MFVGLIKKIVLSPCDKIVRVCFPANLHMLLQYLLITDIADYDRTFFFVHDPIQQTIKDRLKCRCEFNYGRAMSGFEKSMMNVIFWLLKVMLYRLFPFARNAEFYIGDHLVMGWILGCRHKYYLLEDGEGNYRGLTPTQHMGRLRYVVSSILFSPFPKAYWGRSEQCLGRLLSRPVPDGFDNSNVPVFHIEMEKLWQFASEEKKKRIMSYFGVSLNTAKIFNGRTVLLLTQPFSEDGVCSERKKVACYQEVLSQYDPAQVVLKTHPREKTKYREVLDHRIAIVCDPIPMELFFCMGVMFREVVTISSTAAWQFSQRAHVRMLKEML